MKFPELVNEITRIGIDWHRETILANTIANAGRIMQSIRDITPNDKPTLIISAGPSLYRQTILSKIYQRFMGTIIATDGAYIQCLRKNIVPDYVITLDPHPTRMIRWFGDPDFDKNSEGDDYFSRQDLDIEFRKNAQAANEQNIELVNQYADKTKFIMSTTSPQNVVERLCARTEPYWFVPLVDNPSNSWSMTATMVREADIQAMNTGGTVGTAAWVFAHTVLRASPIGVCGMDFGYAMNTPFKETQSYNMLKGYPNISEFYPHYTGFWGEAYTDPTYWWYRENFLDLLKANQARIINCSGEGLLFGDGVGCMDLEQWLTYTK